MSNGKRTDMTRTIPNHRNAQNSTASILGPDTSLVGNIETGADLQVDGRFEGDIICKALVQGEASEIIGAVQAESVRIAGLVRGAISAREVVILKTATIEGDVCYEGLVIEQGARLDGRLTPNGSHHAPSSRGTLANNVAEELFLSPAE